MAEENSCFLQPYPFANDQAQFQFYRRAEPNQHFVPHEDFACTVTMLSRWPGVGKDTWLSRARGDLPMVSLDDLRGELDVGPTDNQGEVGQLARERCREFLRSKTSFAFTSHLHGQLRPDLFPLPVIQHSQSRHHLLLRARACISTIDRTMDADSMGWSVAESMSCSCCCGGRDGGCRWRWTDGCRRVGANSG